MNLQNSEMRALKAKARQAEILLKALANEHRLAILCELHMGERSVSALQEAVGLGQSALSQHLARLRQDSLVVTRRQAPAGPGRHCTPAAISRWACERDTARPRSTSN